MRNVKYLLTLLLAAALFAVSVSAAPTAGAEKPVFPETIELPDGFFPEGITIDDQRQTAYVGSLVGGAIQKLDLKTGASTTLAPALGPDVLSVGMAVDSFGRLWVAGGGAALSPTTVPSFRVYDTETGEVLLNQPVVAGFVNDVFVTGDAAWFTDSFAPTLIRVPIAADGAIGEPEYVSIAGDWEQQQGFNANGITATPDGRHLIVAQATTADPGISQLYVLPIAADGPVLDATAIMLDAPLQSGDGLVLIGRTLYVVGGPGVTKIRLSPGLTSGTVVDVLAVPGALTPTTADAFGSKLYVVDAKFPLFGDFSTSFVVTAIPR